jgi:hypothetical protein
MSFFWANQNSISLAQLDGNIVGEGVESVFWTNMYYLVLNEGGGIMH